MRTPNSVPSWHWSNTLVALLATITLFSFHTAAIADVPAISTVAPLTGPAGTEVSISGSGLASVHTVVFNGTAATSFTVISDTELSATVPDYATSGRVRAINESGTAFSAGTFVVEATPPATSTFLATGDAQVTTRNPDSNYGTEPELRVRAAGTVAREYNSYLRFDVSGVAGAVESALLRLYVSDGSDDAGNLFAVSGDWDESTITWNNAPGTSGPSLGSAGAVGASAWIEFDVASLVTGDGTYSFALTTGSENSTYYSSREGAFPPELVVVSGIAPPAAPAATSFGPARGIAGTGVEIDGSGFVGTSEVAFGGTPAVFLIESDSRIFAEVPAGARSGRIDVTNASGSSSTDADFLVIREPVITSFVPAAGIPGGGVSIEGSGFTGVTTVSFNGVVATEFSVYADDVIAALVPEGATSGVIRATNEAGVAESAESFEVLAPVVVSSFLPEDGPAGTGVAFLGSGFSTVTSISFNGVVSGDFTVFSDTLMTATVPAGATTGKVSVVTPAQTFQTPGDFTVIQAPVIERFDPIWGLAGTEVTMTGTGFTGVAVVTFGGVQSTVFTVESDSVLVAEFPAGASTGKIGFLNAAGSAESADDFHLLEAPEIISFLPGSAAPGFEVNVIGTNLVGVATVVFNGTPASEFTVVSDGQITAVVPPFATSGKIRVANDAGSSMSLTDFQVIDGPAGTTKILASEDALVTTRYPDQNYGTEPELRVRAAGTLAREYNSYLRFDVSGVAGAVESALLRLYVSDGSDDAGNLFAVSGDWDESTITWNNAPGTSGPSLGSAGAVGASAWIEFDVASLVTGDGTYSFALTTGSENSTYYSSREGAFPPELVVVVGGAPTEMPVLTSFSPSSGEAGTGVVLTGSGFSGTSEVTFDEVPTSFLVDSDTRISTVVPAGARTGSIRVTNASGSGTSPSDFLVFSQPTISAFAPSRGIPGAEITINGAGFTGVSSVIFGGTAATAFDVVSDTEMTAIVPEAAISGTIIVVNSMGTAVSAESFTVFAPVVVDVFLPQNGPVGTTVAFQGRGFSTVTSIAFNGVASSAVTVYSDTLMTAAVPAGATAGAITVTTPAQVMQTSQDFVVVHPPVISSFSPGWGLPGLEVTIEGSGFSGVGIVSFAGVQAASFTIESDTRIVAILPEGDTTGKISLLNAAGAVESPGNFHRIQLPVITGFDPPIATSGQQIRILGEDFYGSYSVVFNGTPATAFTVESDSVISAVVPPFATTGKIRVTNDAGTGFSTIDFQVDVGPSSTQTFVSSADAQVTTRYPETNYGSAPDLRIRAPGDEARQYDSYVRFDVTDVGSGVDSAILRLYATDPGDDGGALHLVSNDWAEGSITWNNAPGASGSPIASASAVGANAWIEFDVTSAINGSGSYSFLLTSGSTNSVFYSSREGLFAPELVVTAGGGPTGTPILSSFTPSIGVAGTEIELRGSNFAGVSGVTFGGFPATFTIDSDSRIVTHVPAGARTGRIRITNAIGSALSGVEFQVISQPVISSFTPLNGFRGGEVTLSGFGFTGVSSVTFDGWPADVFHVVDDNTIVATIPEDATTGPIAIANTVGVAATSESFAVYDPIVLGTFSPQSGPVGTSVAIQGAGFSAVTAVSFSGISSADFTVFSDSVMAAIVPAGATTGNVQVVTPAQTVASTSSFTVIQPPVISRFEPTEGLVGTPVTITGSGFTDVAVVSFNGVEASGFSVIGDGLIVAEVPPAATFGKIILVNAAGTAVSTGDFLPIHPPVITSFDPPIGWPGSVVRVFGMGFLGVHSIVFNGTPAPVFSVVSDTEITAVVPQFATDGRIRVSNDAGSAFSPSDFLVDESPPEMSTFLANADALVDSANPDQNFGFDPELRIQANGGGGGTTQSYVRFDVSGVSDGVASARVRLYATEASDLGGDLYHVSNGWNEPTITWNNAPPIAGSIVASAGAVGASAWIEFDVSSVVNGNDTYSFALQSPSTNDVRYSSREGAFAPELLVVLAKDPPPTGVPVLSSFSPAIGPVGTEIELLGSNFAGVSRVTLAGTPLTFLVESSTRITAEVPAGATTGRIELTNATGSVSSGVDFVVIQSPVISGFSPGAGPVGTSVSIFGSGFSGVTLVSFSGVQTGVFNVVSDGLVIAEVPAEATLGRIRLSNSAGTAESTDDFVPIHAPSIGSFSPANGIAGTEVRIYGTGLSEVSSVVFNGTPAKDYNVLTDGEIVATVPEFATTGKIRVSNVAGTALSTADFHVDTVPPTTSTFLPAADAQITTRNPDTNYGTTVELRLRAAGTTGYEYRTYLRFDVTGIVEEVQSARMRLYATDPSGDGGDVYLVDNQWDEDTITWNSAPGISGSRITSGGGVGENAWIEFDLTAVVTGDGTYSFGLKSASSNSVRYSSREGLFSPELVVVSRDGAMSRPALTSFDPPSGAVGTTVELRGSNFLGASSVTFDGTPALFLAESDTIISAIVPAGASTGRIEVANEAGSDRSSSNFTVVHPPSIASFDPIGGVPGTQVSLAGSGFLGTSTVTFGGVGAAFLVISDSEILATVPSEGNSGAIGVTNLAGTATSSGIFSVYAQATVSSFTPLSGPEGTQVAFRGSGFRDVVSIAFSGVPVGEFTVFSDSVMTAVVPDGATTGAISLMTMQVTTITEETFVVIQAPIVTGMSPLTGPVGSEVTIFGRGFTGVTIVAFDGVQARSYTIESDTQITAIVPDGAGLGRVTVLNAAGASESADSFLPIYPPVVASFGPPSGLAGTWVTIEGTDLSTVTKVTFDDVEASVFTALSDTLLAVRVPDGATTGKIGLENVAGVGFSAIDFIVFQVPQIESVDPPYALPNSWVTIRGRGFTSVSAVKFNDADAIVFTADGDTAITVQLPPTASTGPVTVTNLMGTSVSSFDFGVVVTPFITSLDPPLGGVGSTTTIRGTGLAGVTEITLGGVDVPVFTIDADTAITMEVPHDAASGDVIVTNAVGTATSPAPFTVLGLPVVTSVTPSTGVAGSEITIRGTGLATTFQVDFNGTWSTAFTVFSDERVTAVVPEGATSGPVRVTTLGGVGSSPTPFSVLYVPTITSFQPPIAVTGMDVTITGSALASVSAVAFNGAFTGAFDVTSDTTMTARVPFGATTGPIQVTNSVGTGVSATNLAVVQLPVIDELDTVDGVGETMYVQITGRELSFVTSVFLGGIESPTFTVPSDELIVAQIPEGVTGGTVVLTNLAGSIESEVRFSIYPLAVIESFFPTSGSTGDVVTLLGNGFGTVTSVVFNGTPAPDFTVVSDNEIRVVVPPFATDGKIRVTNDAGTAVSAIDFDMMSAPALSQFSAAADGYVRMNKASTNYGSEAQLRVRAEGTTGTEYRSYLTFDVTGVFGTVDSATLRLYCTDGGSHGGDVHRASGGFDESTLTWNEAPAIVGDKIAGVEAVAADTWVEFDLASLITGDGSYTIALVGESSNSVYYTSREGANPPELLVVVQGGTPSDTPVLSSFSPSAGVTGTEVELLGSHFEAVSSVTFDGVPTPFVIESSSRILTVVPSGASTGRIEIANVNGSDTATTDFLVVALPAIASFSPTVGIPGTEITITGSGFTGASEVKIGPTAITAPTVVSDGEITVTVPEGSVSGRVSVTNLAGTAMSGATFAVYAPLAVTSFSPQNGVVGTVVTLEGSGFTGVSSVEFNGIAVGDVVVTSDATMTAVVPPGSSTGAIEVSTPAQTVRMPTSFTVYLLPSIASLGAVTGTAEAMTVSVTGSGFAGVYSVKLAGVESPSFTVESDALITARIPDGVTSGTVVVTNPAGSAESDEVFNARVEPTITSFAPSSGTPGTEVHVYGSNLLFAHTVVFNGTPASDFTVISDVEISVVVPPFATDGTIRVATAAGIAFSPSEFDVISVPSSIEFPVVADAYVKSSSEETNYGSSEHLRIRAGNSNSAEYRTYLEFDVAGLAGTVESATLRLYCTDGGHRGGDVYLVDGNWNESTITWDNAPKLVGDMLLRVSAVSTGEWVEFDLGSVITGNGTYSIVLKSESTNSVYYSSREGDDPPELHVVTESAAPTVAPSLSSFSPATGGPGTEVVLLGANFKAASSVTFDGIPAIFLIDSESRITAWVPAGATSGRIEVANDVGTSASGNDFVVSAAPTIVSFAPTAVVPGTEVTITGSGLAGVTSVTFGALPAADFAVASDTELRATTPEGAADGSITVANSAGTAVSTENFTVFEPVTISSVSPTDGPVGTSVTFEGNGFAGVTSVSFGGVVVEELTVVSSTSMAAVVPAGASSGEIRVTTPAQTVLATPFTVILPPVITSLGPVTGSADTMEISIAGHGFTGVYSVTLAGVEATSFSVVSDSLISAEIPPGVVSGTIVVMNAAGSSESEDMFHATVEDLTFAPIADAYVKSSSANTNYGSSEQLRVRAVGTNDTEYRTFLAFDVSGLEGAVSSARLRLYCTDGGYRAGDLYHSSGSWDESSITWNNAPSLVGDMILRLSAVEADTWVEFDVSSIVTGNGTFTIALKSESANSVYYSSREGANAPELVVEAGGSLPAIVSFQPAVASAGDLVRVRGESLDGATQVTFGSVAADRFTVVSEYEIEVEVPRAARTGKISIESPAGRTSASEALVVPAAFEEIGKGGGEERNAITTSTRLGSGVDQIYLAAIASRPASSVKTVTGLGLTWQRVETAAHGTDTVLELWMATGSSAGGKVTATFESNPKGSSIVVSRYSGINVLNPIGSVVRRSGDGPGEADDRYSLDITTTTPGSVVFGAATMRDRTHTRGKGSVERADWAFDAGSDRAGIAIQDEVFVATGTHAIEGRFSGGTEWAFVGVELVAAPVGRGGLFDPVAALLEEAGDARTGAWGDFDGDGDRDLYLIREGSNQLFRRDESGFVDVTARPLGEIVDGRSASWVDTDNDGDLDLYVVARGENRHWVNLGDGKFEAGGSEPLADARDGSTAAWTDVDGDGDQDLYLVNADGPNVLLANDGTGEFTDVTPEVLANAGDANAVAWGDFDNDGDLDLYVGRDGANRLFRNDGERVFVDATDELTANAGVAHEVVWTDVDLDGDLDLYVANERAEESVLLLSDGRGRFTDGTGSALRHARGNHWLNVRLVGTASNRSGIGARVRVVTGETSQVREITAASGLALRSLTADFGLGSASQADSVVVSWPSGVVQIATDVSADQVLPLTETRSVPGSGVHPAQPEGLPFQLYSSFPNPFRSTTAIRFDLPAASDVDLRVYDVAGRLVKVLESSRRDPGRHTVRWDGYNENGRRVAAGVYFYKLKAGNFRQTKRMMVLR